MTRRLVRRALNFQGRHAQAISLVLSFALCVALIVAVLGWRSARDAQRRLTSVELQLTTEKIGKDIADVALVLDGRTQRLLDAAAVERRDGLKLVESDRETLLARLGDSRGQRKDLGRQTCGIAV